MAIALFLLGCRLLRPVTMMPTLGPLVLMVNKMLFDVVQWLGVQVPFLPLGLGLGSLLASPHPSSKPHPSRDPTACAGGLPVGLHLEYLRARRRPGHGDQVRRRVRVGVKVGVRVRVRVRVRVG